MSFRSIPETDNNTFRFHCEFEPIVFELLWLKSIGMPDSLLLILVILTKFQFQSIQNWSDNNVILIYLCLNEKIFYCHFSSYQLYKKLN